MFVFSSYPIYLFFKWLDNRTKKRAREFEDQLMKKITGKLAEIQHALTSFNSIVDNERYISKNEYPSWLSQWEHLEPLIDEYSRSPINTEFDGELHELSSACARATVFEDDKSLIS
jgi:hypothetical protein